MSRDFLNPAVMPYEFYCAMSDEDLASVVFHLRSIPPLRKHLLPGDPNAVPIVAVLLTYDR